MPFFQRFMARRRALIIGTRSASQFIIKVLEEKAKNLFDVTGLVSVKLAEEGATVDGKPILGEWDDTKALIQQHKIDALIIAAKINDELVRFLPACYEMGVDVIPMTALYEHLTGRVPINYIDETWFFVLLDKNSGMYTFSSKIKRLIDISVSTMGLIFFVLILPLIAAAIYIDSPGPIFYKQKRVGQGGRVFSIYKFRSMKPDVEKGNPVWAENNDPRVTKVGRILRKTYIDELPQFLNILKGDMSLVGPRPERPELVEELALEIPFFKMRQAVKPGMAGWALVKQGYASSKEEAAIKLEYDLYYIKHQSLWLDAIIFFKTIFNMLTFRGR